MRTRDVVSVLAWLAVLGCVAATGLTLGALLAKVLEVLG